MIHLNTLLIGLSIIFLSLSCQDEKTSNTSDEQTEPQSTDEEQNSEELSEQEDEQTDSQDQEQDQVSEEENLEENSDIEDASENESDNLVKFTSLAESGDVVEFVNIDRYMGTWYEIATTPSVQQRFCYGTTAQYNYNEAEDWVEVYNRCNVASADGRQQEIMGRAEVFDQETQAKLEVFFFENGSPYWVVELDGSESEDQYQWVVVSVPNKQTIWILSRTPQMEEGLRSAINQRLLERGYPIDRLLETPQP